MEDLLYYRSDRTLCYIHFQEDIGMCVIYNKTHPIPLIEHIHKNNLFSAIESLTQITRSEYFNELNVIFSEHEAKNEKVQ